MSLLKKNDAADVIVDYNKEDNQRRMCQKAGVVFGSVLNVSIITGKAFLKAAGEELKKLPYELSKIR